MSGVRRFQQRRVPVVQAIQWTGENRAELREFVGSGRLDFNWTTGEECAVYNQTEYLWFSFTVGDWIVKDVDGEFVPYKPFLFEDMYAEVTT